MLFLAYVLCMYGLYSFMPLVVKMTSATAVNLSLLTADLFSLFCGILLFQYKVNFGQLIQSADMNSEMIQVEGFYFYISTAYKWITTQFNTYNKIYKIAEV